MVVQHLPIVKEPNKVLRKIAGELSPADIRTPRIQKLLAEMKATLAETPDGVGLAAPQVGESLRIFLVSEESEHIGGENYERDAASHKALAEEEKKKWKHFVYINPVIKKISKNKVAYPEGCLSVPGTFGVVNRPEKITVEAYNESGKKFTRGASRFFARVLQHEIDHLAGVLFIDKAKKLIAHKQ